MGDEKSENETFRVSFNGNHQEGNDSAAACRSRGGSDGRAGNGRGSGVGGGRKKKTKLSDPPLGQDGRRMGRRPAGRPEGDINYSPGCALSWLSSPNDLRYLSNGSFAVVSAVSDSVRGGKEDGSDLGISPET